MARRRNERPSKRKEKKKKKLNARLAFFAESAAAATIAVVLSSTPWRWIQNSSSSYPWGAVPRLSVLTLSKTGRQWQSVFLSPANHHYQSNSITTKIGVVALLSYEQKSNFKFSVARWLCALPPQYHTLLALSSRQVISVEAAAKQQLVSEEKTTTDLLRFVSLFRGSLFLLRHSQMCDAGDDGTNNNKKKFFLLFLHFLWVFFSVNHRAFGLFWLILLLFFGTKKKEKSKSF